jgi:phthiocerol/phenolphthiocerol synthesis type-I polyketide synthase C
MTENDSTRTEVEGVEVRESRLGAACEPIAVVGVGCRYPGIRTPRGLWDFLAASGDVLAADQGRSEGRLPGGRIDGIDRFDAEFFGVSPYQAVRMDPQQRLLLETAWEALEDAGIPVRRAAELRTGVFVAQLASSYDYELRRSGILDIHSLVNSSYRSSTSARVAHALRSRGPAVTIDAACAASLAAVHLACQSLRLAEVDLALAGGVHLVNSAQDSAMLADAGLLSPSAEGRCRFGDVGADGFVRCEGTGVVVLKNLKHAVADGDRIYAVILGSALTHDTASDAPFMTPTVEGQAAMLRAACANAGVDVHDIDYVEAHGTGTPVGDRVELTALARVLGAGRPADRPLLVGSVKTNLGHTEGAAGVTGLIKTALSLWHRRIPASLHLTEPNPEVSWDGVEPARRPRPWPQTGRPGVAGVSALGIAGQDVHVVLTEAPAPVEEPQRHRRPTQHLLPVSARSSAALEVLVGEYERLLAGGPPPKPADVCASAGARRSHLSHRIAVSGSTRQDLLRGLRDAVREAPMVQARRGRPRVVFVFPGAGAQQPGMARRLLHDSPVFRAALEHCDAAIRAESGSSPIERLRSGAALTAIDEAQPALWAVEVALAALWRHWGVAPDVVIGHSMGEIAAATVTGALTVEQGAAIVCRRSGLMRSCGGRGAMGSVQLGAAQAWRRIAEQRADLVVAAYNAPTSTVLSGDPADLDRMLEALAGEGVHARRVRTDVASHCVRMEPVLAELRGALAGLRPRAGSVPIRSTVTGLRTDGSGLDAEYWAANLREPVNFHEAVDAELAGPGSTLFVEMSAHPTLLAPIAECATDARAQATAVGSLQRDRPDLAALFASLADAYAAGCDLDWEAVNGPGRFVDLPTYPWQRKSYWFDTVAPAYTVLTNAELDDRAALLAASGAHGLLAAVPSPAPVLAPAFPPAALALPGPLRPAAGGEDGPADPLSPRELREHVVRQVAKILQLAEADVDVDTPMTLLGLDSLMATDLCRRVERSAGVRLPVRALLTGGTLRGLVDEALSQDPV